MRVKTLGCICSIKAGGEENRRRAVVRSRADALGRMVEEIDPCQMIASQDEAIITGTGEISRGTLKALD